MKKKFIFALALMTILFSMTAFAAKGWTNTEQGWKFYDSNECEVTCEWKRSGDDWYYLGSDGLLMTDALIDNEDGTYSFVDETGARVSNVWLLKTDEARGLDDNWIYIKSNGKSVKDGWYTVKGEKYCFADNKMLTGYINESAPASSYADATAYCDENGKKVSGWVEKYDDDGNHFWLYFKGGKKVSDCIITINNAKYMFDSDGKMLTGTQATNSVVYRFNSDGAMVRKSWVEVTDDNGDNYWIYSTADGSLVQNGQYKVNGKYYFFQDTVMKTGWQSIGSAERYYKADGSMAIGTVKIANKYGDDVTYYFMKDGAPADDGYNGKAYGYDENGHGGMLVVPADDHKYVIFNNKLVNKSGTYQKKGTYKDSAYDKTYVVDDNGNVTVK